MYVAVKGGEEAIRNAHRLLSEERRGPESIPELSVAQIREQLRLSVDRVMTEGSLFDADLAALAIKQARGDLVEAIFLLRAYRTTLPRLGTAEPFDTGKMRVRRRISATFKDVPGGQVLGPTFDYTHRLLDFSLAAEQSYCNSIDDSAPAVATSRPACDDPSAGTPRVSEVLGAQGLLESCEATSTRTAGDLTTEPLAFPAERDLRLQNLARADEGFLLALGYSTQRGYGRTHPFVGEIRVGDVPIEVFDAELGFAIEIGEISLTECEMVNQFSGSETAPPQFTRGYGLSFGHSERKAMAMALVDRSLRARELGEPMTGAPAQDEEFVLSHSDNVQASGFVEHLKLPHYVDFQSELEFVRRLREEHTVTRGMSTQEEGRVLNAIRDVDVHGNAHEFRAEAPWDTAYNFAYLDEHTKRMIRRALLKAIAIPGCQVPFASREMPMPYGWGTGGIQVTAAILGPDDVLKVIDQGADDTTNAVSIRGFFERVAGVATTEDTTAASIIQTRHRIPETPLSCGQILVYQVPIPEPLRFLEPRETETRTMHALEEYGLMHVKLYEDIATHGYVATTYAYPVQVAGRYVTDPSPIPKFDNPKMHQNPALQLFGAGREKRIYAIPPFTEVRSLDFDDHPFEVQRWNEPCALCGSTDVFLDEIVLDDVGERMLICSDTDYCKRQKNLSTPVREALA